MKKILPPNFFLFFSEIKIYGHPFEVKMLPHLVLQISPVRLPYILWMVAEKGKCRRSHRQLGYKLDRNHFPLYRRGRVALNGFQHYFIQLMSRYFFLAVFIHFHSGFQSLKYPRLLLRRNEKDGHIGKGSNFLLNFFPEDLMRTGFFLYQVPFIDQYHYTLVPFLSQEENIHILRFQAFTGINEQEHYIRFFHGADSPHDGIKLNVLADFAFFTDSGSI